MYGGFGNVKLFGGGAHGGFILQNVFAKFNSAFFNGSLHLYHPVFVFCTLYGAVGENMQQACEVYRLRTLAWCMGKVSRCSAEGR